MLLRNKVFKAGDIIFKAIVITLLLSLRHNNGNEGKKFHLDDNIKLKGVLFAGDSSDIDIKVRLLFNSDLDGSRLIDGRDLALLMYYFGKTEDEYNLEGLKANPDINRDKIVDGEDLVILASRFGLRN